MPALEAARAMGTQEQQVWQRVVLVAAALTEAGLPAFFNELRNRSNVSKLPRDVQSQVLAKFHTYCVSPLLAQVGVSGGAGVSAAPPELAREVESWSEALGTYARKAFLIEIDKLLLFNAPLAKIAPDQSMTWLHRPSEDSTIDNLRIWYDAAHHHFLTRREIVESDVANLGATWATGDRDRVTRALGLTVLPIFGNLFPSTGKEMVGPREPK